MKISTVLFLHSLCFAGSLSSCAAATFTSPFYSHLRGNFEQWPELRSEHPRQNSAAHTKRTNITYHLPQVISEQERHSHPPDSHADASGHAASGDRHGLGYSLCLLGAVAFNMSLLYLINHNDAGINFATWQVLSMTLSIFVAVMGYATIRAICVDSIAASHGPNAVLAASLTLFLVIFAMNEGILYFLKSPKNAHILHSGAALGCHFLGFAACYSFADMQRAALFGTSTLGNSLVLLIAALVLAGLAFIARFAHEWVENLHQAEREHLEDIKWEKEVEAMEDEAVSLCMGYLLVQTIAYGIRGSHDSVKAEIAPDNVSQRQVNIITIWFVAFFLLTIFGFVLGNWWLSQTMKSRTSVHGVLRRVDTLNYEQVFAEHDVPWHVRLLMIVLHSLNVAMAWCVLLLAEWQVYSLGFKGYRIAACMLVGILLTLLAFATIFVLEWIANHVHTKRKAMDPKKVFRSMTLALGIVIGFAWERAFHVGLHDVAHALTYSHAAEDFFIHVMACGLVIIVTPAWAMYVFPKVRESEDACFVKYENQT